MLSAGPRLQHDAVPSYSVPLCGNVEMDPDAVYEPQAEHDHEDERAAIADQRQWHAGDWQHCDCHSYVLEDVGEDKRSDAYDEKKTQLVAREKRDEKTRHQE